jgi:hypothetical protein
MRRRRVLLLVAIALIALVYGYVWFTRPRSTVTVRNAGPRVLHGVVVHIRDTSYPLGDVRVAESASAKVHLQGKEQVGIEFSDPPGQAKQLLAPATIPEGLAGTVTVTIKDDQVDKIETSAKPPE